MNRELGIRKIENKRGFSLVEVIVSLAILAIVALINLAVVFSVSNAQKKAIALQNSQDNIRYAFEAMTKEIRTGYAFSGGGSSFSFTNSYIDSGGLPAHTRVTYARIGTQLVRSSPSETPCPSGLIPADNCQIITSTSVKITNLSFVVSAGAGVQSKVTIIIQGKVNDPRTGGVGPASAELNLQTTISRERLSDS